MHILPSGKVHLDFKRPWSDGSSCIVLEPQALIARLAAKACGRVAGWAELCQSQFFLTSDYQQATIRLLGHIEKNVFEPPFRANELFDRLEASPAIQEASEGTIDFDDADPLGELYAHLYPNLTEERKEKCFQRLCQVAVRLHRYSVMKDVRTAFSLETNQQIKARLLSLLEREDQQKVIHGRGTVFSL